MKNSYLVILFVLVIALIYHSFYIPGSRVAHDYPLVSMDSLKSLLDIPRAWTERGSVGLGEYSVFTLWSWPLNLLSGVLAYLGIGFSFQERIYLSLFVITLGIYGVFKLGAKVGLKLAGKLAAALFFLSNTYILLLIDGGQLNIAFAYSVLPLAFFYLSEAIDVDTLKSRVTAALLISLLGLFDIRFVLIFGLLICSYFAYRLLFCELAKARFIVKTCSIFVTVAVVYILLNCYWIIPLVFNPLESGVYDRLTRISSAGQINIGHAFLLLSPHWYENIFGKVSQPRGEFGLFLILVFLAPILRRKDLWVGFWLILFVVAVFLSKGISPPFGGVYLWLYSHLPGFSLFRDSSKFLALVAMTYSFLIGVTFEEVFFGLKKSQLLQSLFVFFFLGLILLLTFPAWSWKMTGTFSSYLFKEEFEKVSKILQADKDFSRSFLIPASHPLGYSSPTHPIIEAARLYNMVPFVYGVKGSYEAFNFLREAPFTGEMFDVMGISRIVYPPLNPKRDEMSEDHINYYKTFLDQLSHLSWISGSENMTIPVLDVKNHQNKFFINTNIWGMFGPVDLLNEATKAAALRLANNSIIFIEEKPNMGQLLEEIPEIKLVLRDRTVSDVVGSFIKEEELISLSNSLQESPDASGWWKRGTAEVLDWRDFLKSKYNLEYQDLDYKAGWAVAEGNLSLKIRNERIKSGQVLLARVMESSRSGNLRFFQNGKQIGDLNLISDRTATQWFEVGKLQSEGYLEIRSSGDINAVNLLAIVDENTWRGYKDKSQSLLLTLKEFAPDSVDLSMAKVAYEKINPTKYKVRIINLKSPGMLVFSSTYHSGWELGGEKSIPIFGLLNGFRIDHNGDYIVEFKPQRYVNAGLVVSGLSLGLIFLLLSII